MRTSHLERVRAYELEEVVAEIPPGSRVLEIGAGPGYQARALSELGFDVEAVDLRTSTYAEVRVWPVIDYDGRRLPFTDAAFDVVFSSHVLEHVRDGESFQAEIARVLRPGGRAIHVLPTATWRLWTILSHYAYLAKFAALVARPRPQPADSVAGRDLGRWSERRREPWSQIFRRALRIALPLRHGERGNWLSEAYWFSRFYWVGLFRRCGWIVERRRPLRLFYTGHELLGARLAVSVRRPASFLLGSSSMLYVVRR